MATSHENRETIPITKLRAELLHLPDLLKEGKLVTVTRRGNPVATILSSDTYQELCEELEHMRREIESMRETIEILQDSELMDAIREGMQAIQNGDTVSLEEARHALGLT